MNSRSLFILGRKRDFFFLTASPLLSLFLVLSSRHLFGQNDNSIIFVLAMIATGGHLLITFARTHGNSHFLAQHKFRFLVLPLVLLIAMTVSQWVLYFFVLILPFWDAYHSAMQNFGIARSLDQKMGLNPQIHRRREMIFNHVLFSAPLVCGPHFIRHFSNFSLAPNSHFFLTRFPSYYTSHEVVFVQTSFIIMLLFGLFYLLSGLYQRALFNKRKYFFYLSIGITNTYAWMFTSWIEALTIINLYHAVQYYALVWDREQASLLQKFRLDFNKISRIKLAFLFFGLSLLYGFHRNQTIQEKSTVILFTLFSVLHFYYDSFIWSVRRKQF